MTHAHSRRGSIYLLVLGTAAILTVIGLTASAMLRIDARRAVLARQTEQAAIAAASAVDIALALTNLDPLWRKSYTKGAPTCIGEINGCHTEIWFADEADDDLGDGAGDPVRVYGSAYAGSARRTFSVLATPGGGAGVSALDCAVHSDSTITTAGSPRATGAPVSSNLTLTNSGQLYADVQAAVVTSSGMIHGAVTHPAARTNPDPITLPTNYTTGAATIPFGAIPSGIIDQALISPKANPYGVASDRGIYEIVVPAGSTLRIRRSRIVATLHVQLLAGSQLDIRDQLNWQPPQPNWPALLVSGISGTVTIGMSADPLTEPSGRSFNPDHTPYLGDSDSDSTDTFPSQIRGIVHVLAPAIALNIHNATTITGAVLSEGQIALGGTISIAHDPTLRADPAPGYAAADGAGLTPIAGSFRWVVD